MESLTSSQWARYSELANRLERVSAAEREAKLRALFDQREDPVVLSLVALRLRLLTEEASRHTGKKVGKYTLKELIGAGGMGVAYLAEHDVTLQPAVVKLIHPCWRPTRMRPGGFRKR